VNITCFETKLPVVSSNKLSKQRIRTCCRTEPRFCLFFSLSSFTCTSFLLLYLFIISFLFFSTYWSRSSTNAGPLLLNRERLLKLYCKSFG